MAEARPFTLFSGVYRPVVLTVLGALLYLREGWLVGNAGLGGALLIIFAAYTITGTTALSVASIATNLRLRAGGAFAIISAALGLEAGGAIGVPLYIAQTLSSAMYLYAFSEGWGYLFPEHDPRLVVLGAFVATGMVTLISSRLASRAQAVMLVVVGLALSSAFLGWFTAVPQRPRVFADFGDATLLESFALFFPAATGIMVGAGMSGSLDNPRRAIPLGTLAAWGTTLVLYAAGAVWYATVVPLEELRTNPLAMVEHALVGELVLFGLLSSTLMAALSSLVAAPRLLQAMAEHRILPGSTWLARTSPAMEPRNATWVTLGLAAVALLAGSLNAIAPVITSFFIMTYFAVNVVVFLEQQLGLVSWRPTFRIPTWVPAAGALLCMASLVLSAPAGGLPEVAFVVGIYLWLSRRTTVDTPWETVQSGIAQTVAAWAAVRARRMRRSERTWKPDLLVPVRTVDEARSLTAVARSLIEVRGSAKFVAVVDEPELGAVLGGTVRSMRRRDQLASWHVMPEDERGQAARLSINAMQGGFFAPNLLLISARHTPQEVLEPVVEHARTHRLGVVVVFDEADEPFGSCRQATVWLSERSPGWELSLHVANLDLPVLLAYLLTRPLRGGFRLATVLRAAQDRPLAASFLQDLIELGRLPMATPHVLDGPFEDRLADAPPSDVHIFGLSDQVDRDRMAAIHARIGVPCLFVLDSGQESALA